MNSQVFKNKLNSILKDNAIERYVGGKKRGKLNNKRLYKISHSEKIFKGKEERKGKDYSVTFLLDASGSMGGARAKITCESIENLCNVFQKINVPTSVFAFQDVVRQLKNFNEKYVAGTLTKLYDKTYCVKYYYCYSCGDMDIEQRHFCKKYGRIVESNRTSGGGTNDAIGLYMTADYATKNAIKNIIIVITDGEGNNIQGNDGMYQGKIKLSDLKSTSAVVKAVKKKYPDTIILAVGIMASHVGGVYGNQNVINIKNTDEMFDAVAKLLSRNIKRS